MTAVEPSLSARLSTLSESNKTTLHLIQRLSKLNFQPGSVPLVASGGDEGDDVLTELSSEIHESLKQQEEELELLKQDVEEASLSGGSRKRRESDKGRDQTRLHLQVVRLGEDLKK